VYAASALPIIERFQLLDIYVYDMHVISLCTVLLFCSLILTLTFFKVSGSSVIVTADVCTLYALYAVTVRNYLFIYLFYSVYWYTINMK
jgi:hypothetical protein